MRWLVPCRLRQYLYQRGQKDGVLHLSELPEPFIPGSKSGNVQSFDCKCYIVGQGTSAWPNHKPSWYVLRYHWIISVLSQLNISGPRAYQEAEAKT
jgi:hypothetical protein